MIGELDVLIEARKQHPKDNKTKWYYYDQAPFQQKGKKRNIVLGPKGLKIYDPARITLKYPSLTLHMIVDQDGEIFDFCWNEGGQGAEAITKFLTKAASRLPRNTKGVLYCDHLGTHRTLSERKAFPWKVRLVPVSSSDSNIIEGVFSSLKTHLYCQLRMNKKVYNSKDLITWCESATTQAWWNDYDGDEVLFKHSLL